MKEYIRRVTSHWGNTYTRLFFISAILTVFIQFALPTSALTTTPTTMNFQGRLTNSSGNIMADGLYNMKFRIYDDPSSGTLKWSETRETTNRVQVTNGLFSVQIGQVIPLDPTIFDDGALYFEIELPTTGTATCSTASCQTWTEGPMTPRNKLSTSAYAYNSETLDGIDSAQFARNDQANTFAGAQTVRADSTNAFQVQNAAGTSTFMNVDTSLSKVTIKSGTDTAVIGGELFSSSYAFNTATGWTPSGTGSSATAVHASGTTAITTTFPVSSGTTYVVAFTTTGASGDYLSASIGGVGMQSSYASGTYRSVVTTTGTGALTFSPSNNWVGTISSVSIKQITTSTTPVFQINSSTGATALELRTGPPTYANLFLGENSGRYTTGSDNISLGKDSLSNNTTGTGNIALGTSALKRNTSGGSNLAIGLDALSGNTTGFNNIALGELALTNSVAGNRNVAVGWASGYNVNNGTDNTYIGYYSGAYDGSFTNGANLQNAAAIGSEAVAQASNSIVLGKVTTETRVAIGTTVPDSLFSVSPVYYPLPANANIKASQSGNTVTSSGSTATVFTSAMVGMRVVFANGMTGTITAVGSATQLTLSSSQTVSSQVFRIHTGGFQVSNTGDALIKNTSTTAFTIQNAGGTALWTADTTNSQVVIGTTSNGIILTANGVTLAGTARPTRTATLSPEYAGATFTGDGSNNTGSLTSDFCSGSGSGGINVNASACGTGSTTRNYYQWSNTQATAQDYDVYVRYQIPSNYSTGSMTNLKLLAWGDTTTTESATVEMFVDGTTTVCSTSSNAITSNATWTSATTASPLGSCTISAGDMVTFRIHLSAGQNKGARASDISFNYKTTF